VLIKEATDRDPPKWPPVRFFSFSLCSHFEFSNNQLIEPQFDVVEISIEIQIKSPDNLSV